MSVVETGGADFTAKLDLLVKRYESIVKSLEDPDVFSDVRKYTELAKERTRLEDIVERYRRYIQVKNDIEASLEVLATEQDEDMKALFEEELQALKAEQEELEAQLARDLIPRDPNDDRSVICEIRAGTGGEEAALFAGDLFRMYGRYAESQGWKVEILSSNPTDLGGFKEVIFAIEGDRAYGRLKYEAGVHRVQRVPTTESSGRIHTSTATVAVLPEAEEVDVVIEPKDIRVDTFCASGHGGQGVNTTYSAVRITHLLTGIQVSCQDERSQIQNRERAMRVLRSRLKALMEEQQAQEISQVRRSQVGTGERSEKIRTYNFPQNRVTDHRIGLTTHRLQQILDGELDEIIDALALSD
ncbi:MAG TPA: peptide chain release factor 1, partial [Firmicutes bacterium]|nr:peptide chain release factor 1 [Candidatus Fermentithermobacillaceae bacterium]